jgi:hypothetical protein
MGAVLVRTFGSLAIGLALSAVPSAASAQQVSVAGGSDPAGVPAYANMRKATFSVTDTAVRVTAHMVQVKRRGVFNVSFLPTTTPGPMHVIRAQWKDGTLRTKLTVYTDAGSSTRKCRGLSSAWSVKKKTISVTYPQSCYAPGSSLGAYEFNTFLDAPGGGEVDNIGYLGVLYPRGSTTRH